MWKNKLFFILITLSFSIQSYSNGGIKELLILHTNDTHSQIEPTSSGDCYNGKGGYVRRAGFISNVRKNNKAFLLLDAGDFLQGTPYFNFFKGEVETKAINAMRYDAITLGNHEFDNGVEALVAVLSQLKVPVVNCNYDVSKTALAPLVKPFIIVKKRGLKIGILGLGANPKNLITKKNFTDIVYLNPIEQANFYAKQLKESHRCDLVICLSHLGDEQKIDSISDLEIASHSTHIDVIIGGHSHKLIDDLQIPNLNGKPIPIVQAGRTGAYIGSINILFRKEK